jgi:transposase
VSMIGSYPKAEILTGPERWRRWTVAEKLAMVAETREPGVTVSLVARRRGVSPNQLFTWRQLAEQGALTATQAEEEVVPASAFRAQQEHCPCGGQQVILFWRSPRSWRECIILSGEWRRGESAESLDRHLTSMGSHLSARRKKPSVSLGTPGQRTNGVLRQQGSAGSVEPK